MQGGSLRTRDETQNILAEMKLNTVMLSAPSENTQLQTAKGIKDTFLHFFLDIINRARLRAKKNKTSEASAVDSAFRTLPQTIFSPIWRLEGMILLV